ncbi:hypothetical protein C351_00247 [Cryptococcus neoformans c8]|nr:hypothetical protein C353_00251 [Cryptococcus neoformans var. grubii AD1-83a]OXG69482.1 hypothetical protein C351_00247 [Cryptococcus neoformans var. grubii c8]OXG70274.1 hypothetical protein C354_00254 [Cryptococcus neoformans var. grubii MW-RSA1955]OXG73648.1 hypothetical protein C352_00251 [Cryptococcus neoformans var. grubii CHC193]OXH19508.1 hypothetical protein C369_00249 [Cryptococcus neoformans var. grubii A5-35-17]OXH20662.1 hypothetical protein C370_00247 [Cryptococcus neoformans 
MLRSQLRLPRFPLQSIYSVANRPSRRFSHAFPTDVPPLRQRIRPLVPFFIYWTIITSLVVHLMRTRQDTEASLARQQAKVTVLSDLIARLQRGETVDEEEMQRELEMVGLRERTSATLALDKEMRIVGDVGWRDVLFGKKERTAEDDAKEERIIEEWTSVINEPANAPPPPPSANSRPRQVEQPQNRAGVAKRAPGSNVYL